MCCGYQIWSEETLVQVYDDDDLHEGQRSSEVKCGKLCTMVTKLGQKKPWCKFMMMMMTFMKVKSHQKVKCGKLCTMVTKLGQKMMTFMEVKGQMRLNIVNYVPWLQTWSGH